MITVEEKKYARECYICCSDDDETVKVITFTRVTDEKHSTSNSVALCWQCMLLASREFHDEAWKTILEVVKAMSEEKKRQLHEAMYEAMYDTLLRLAEESSL